MNGAGFKASSPGRLAERAYREIEQRIVTLALPPGQLLAERQLVTLTGIGRTPVREAVQQLVAAGLLLVLPRKGLVVTPLVRTDIIRLLEARKVLERLTTLKAAERATQTQRLAIGQLGERLQAETDLSRHLPLLGMRLSELIASACDNPYLARSLAASEGQLRRLWCWYWNELDLRQVAVLHAQLAQAVAGSDCNGAVRAKNGILALLVGLAARLERLG